MSVCTIQSPELTVSVGTAGAELLSLRGPDGSEQMWCGDPDIWGRRGPVIFPILGGWPEGYYICGDKKYFMDKNGFARSREFSVCAQDESSVRLELRSDEQTRSQYPLDFALSVLYYVVGRAVHVRLSASNDSDTVMYAGVGLHPGFTWDRSHTGTRLVFQHRESVKAFHPDAVRYPFLNDENEFELRTDSFSRGAITMENLKSSWVELRRPKPEKSLRIGCAGFSYFTAWSMDDPKAEFVCLEPSTTANTDGSRLEDRRGIIAIEPGETLSREITIELFD